MLHQARGYFQCASDAAGKRMGEDPYAGKLHEEERVKQAKLQAAMDRLHAKREEEKAKKADEESSKKLAEEGLKKNVNVNPKNHNA